jgi:hypothetical protein
MSSRKLSRGINFAMIALAVAGQGYILAQANSPVMPAPPGAPLSRKPAAAKPISINLDKAVPLNIPTPKKELKSTPFTNQRLSGWIIKLPGDRPIATPADYKGKLYVGGGYGSHEFYQSCAESLVL